MKATLKSQSEGVDPLIGIRISECERRAAKTYLRQGERVADFLIAAITAMRGVPRAFRALARIKPAN